MWYVVLLRVEETYAYNYINALSVISMHRNKEDTGVTDSKL